MSGSMLKLLGANAWQQVQRYLLGMCVLRARVLGRNACQQQYRRRCRLRRRQVRVQYRYAGVYKPSGAPGKFGKPALGFRVAPAKPEILACF